MKPQIELGIATEPIKGLWSWYSCEYSLDGGQTWLSGEVQSDGYMTAEETLRDEDGNEVEWPEDKKQAFEAFKANIEKQVETEPENWEP